MRASPFILSLLVLAGCVNPPTKPEQLAAAPSEAKQVCTRERHVGSDIPVTACAPVQTEAESKQAMENLRQQMSRPAQMAAPGSP